MCVKNTHFKCLKSYYRDLRVEVTHLFLGCSYNGKADYIEDKTRLTLIKFDCR